MSEADRFVEQWAAIWREHDGEAWTDLLHEEGVLRNPIRELRRQDLISHMFGIVAAIPEHRIELLRWGETADGVLIEWEMSGRLAAGRFELRGADRFVLRDGKAVDGVAYFDPRPLVGDPKTS